MYTMSKIYLILIVTLSIIYGICGGRFKQEMAKVSYINSKYIKDVHVLTVRENRNSPYLTSFKATNLLPFSDNVTVRLEFINPKKFPIQLEIKVCEGLKLNWAHEWLRTYSDLTLKCPLPVGTFHFNKFEIPPKNFPIQFSNIDYTAKSTIFLTGTGVKICEASVELRFNSKKG